MSHPFSTELERNHILRALKLTRWRGGDPKDAAKILATLSGTGVVFLQSLPFSRLADQILRHAPSAGGRSKEQSSLGGALGGALLGGLLDGRD